MRRLTLFLIVLAAATAVFALFALFTPTAQADEVGGIIDTDTTWTLAGSPYIITDTIIIQPGVTLTVEAGVEVQAQPNTAVEVNGTLLALGTAVQPITFTSTTESGFYDWHGLDVTGSGVVSLTYTMIRHAITSLTLSGATANLVQLSNSNISQNSSAVFSNINSLHRLVLDNVTFSDNQFNYVWMGGVSGAFSDDVTLTDQPGLEGYVGSSSPFVTIPEGITLTMEAGTTLQFDYLFVHGHLETHGSVTATTVITGFSVTQIEATGSANINHTLIANGIGDGYVGLGILGNSSQPVNIQNSTFAQMNDPIVVAPDALHRLHMENVTFTENWRNRVIIYGISSSLTNDVILTAEPGLEGYEIQDNSQLIVPEGITLTLEAGTTLMMPEDSYLFVDGHLDAQGTVTQPITFTSSINSGPGDWAALGIGAYGTAVLKHVTVQYAIGIGVNNHLANGPVVIEDSLFKDNLYYPIETNLVSLSRLNMTNTTFINNGVNRVFIYEWPQNFLAAPIRLTPQPGLEGYEMDYTPYSIVIPEGLTLTLEAGAALMIPEETSLRVDGHLEALGTPSQPVTFTSAINTGMEQWDGIAVFETGTTNLNHAVVRFSDYGVGAIDASDNMVQITNSLFTQNYSPMWATDRALHRLQMNSVTFNGNDRNRIEIQLQTFPQVTGLSADTRLTSQPGLEGYELVTDNAPLLVPEGITLTLEAGTSLLFPDQGEMQIFGHLYSAGTPTMPVTLTAVNPNNPWSYLAIGDVYDAISDTGSAQLEGTIISDSSLGLVIGKIGEEDRVVIENSTIQDNYLGGDLFVYSLHKTTLSNVQFLNNTYNRLLILVPDADSAVEGNATLTPQPGLEAYQIGEAYDLRIPAGVTLTLAAGTVMMTTDYPNGSDTILVEGRLQAEGTAVAPVILTSGYNTAPGQWQGIVVNGGEVSLTHAEVRYATTNLTVNSPTSTVAITGSRLISASVNSLAINDGTLNTACSLIAGNGQNGVFVSASGSPSVTITTSEIRGNGVGITNSHSLPVNARLNFWGDASGPGGIGPGSGDAVYGNVLYDPWLAAPTCSPPPPPPVLPTISITDSTAVESNPFLTFTVTLNITSEQDVWVDYGTMDGTAVAGVDYLPISGTLMIPARQNTAVLTVTLLNNDLDDGDRNFTLVLSDPINAEIGNGTAVGLILDDDEPPILPTISITDSTDVESDPFLTFTITLNITSEQEVWVDYETMDGTAVASLDYLPISGTLMIPAGQATAVLAVPLINNNLDDGDRSFTLVLSNPVNAELGNDTAVGLILDDDLPPSPSWRVYLPVILKP